MRGLGIAYVVSDFVAVIAACYGALWLWSPSAERASETARGMDTSGFGLHSALLQPIHPSTDFVNAAGVVAKHISGLKESYRWTLALGTGVAAGDSYRVQKSVTWLPY